MIRFGPAGLGGVSDACKNLNEYKKLGLEACEIAFTYGVYIKKKEDAVRIGNEGNKLGIKLSIHAPYYINLNSAEKSKIEESKKRILNCCEIGHYLQAYCVVFHPGYYGKFEKEETYQNIKKAILEIMNVIKVKKWNIKLAPETTGKVNVFGDIDEILRLVKDTKCYFCIDFAHIFARLQGNINYDEYFKKLKNFRGLHIHFSGINYGPKGEKNHIITPADKIKELIKYVKKYNKTAVIINESPDPVGDSIKSLKLL